MDIIYTQVFKTNFGELLLGSFKNKLCLCDWRYRKMRSQIDLRIQEGLDAKYIENSSEIITQTIVQLNEYFNRKRKEFDIPLLFVGSQFQKTVWNALLNIPFGKTATYLELSQKLGNEKAIRAVAAANGANAISIIVPCHRIIGSDGKLVGYAGGLKAKQKLLELEGLNPDNGQLKLFE